VNWERWVRAALLLGIVAAVVSGLAVVASAWAAATPDPLARREVPANAAVDPARPCSRVAEGAPAAVQPVPAGLDARFDAATNTIALFGGQNVSIPALSWAVHEPNALRETAPGVWLVGAHVVVLKGASLQISAPNVRWLKMASGAGSVFVSIKAFGGNVDIGGSCITSWDDGAQRADENYGDGRSFLLARNGATMTIDKAEIRYLGFWDTEAYGLSWRTEGTTGLITNSVVSHNFYGLYTYDVGGLRVQDNEFHDNVLYGIDPHTRSHNLVIERNVVHDNGKHGIVLAEGCVDSVIRDNIVYANAHHGIVMYLGSDRNIIEGNESFGNAAQGININESNGNTIRNNKVYDNIESGVGISQTAADNVVEGNQLRGNQQDGIRLVSEATATTVRANLIGENARYGVYVDSAGWFDLSGNTVFGNRTGVMVRGVVGQVDEDDNRMFSNSEADTKTS
jgi:parallel beta-helix repeat protein